MEVEILYSFPVNAPKKELSRAWLLQEGSDDILVVAFADNKVQTFPFTSSFGLFFFDIKTRSIVRKLVSASPMPNIEALHLAYNSTTATWIIGSIELHNDTYSYHILIRTLHEDEIDPGVLFKPIFDEPANEMAPIGPFLSLTASNQHCTFLYRKSAIDCISTPEICLEHIELLTRKAAHSVISYGESALICQQEHASLLLVLIPQYTGIDDFREEMHKWSFALIGFGDDFETVCWRYEFDGNIPSRRTVLGRLNDFEWLGINAAAIPGPLVPQTKLQTFIVGMTMMDIFDREGFGHTSEEASWMTNKIQALLCIDAKGKLIQKCSDPIGLRLQLCQIGSLTVGVDLVQGQWRLWNWSPVSGISLQKRLWLDKDIQRAHVMAGKGQEKSIVDYFWLMEESSEWVRISKYDPFTMMKIGQDVTLPDVHLLEPQNASGSLDWHTSVDALICRDTLLFLGVDKDDQLVLYQVK